MRWRGRQTSSNVEDRRGQSRGGGRSYIPRGRGSRIGLGTILLMIIVAVFGGNPLQFLDSGGSGQMVQTAPPSQSRTVDAQSNDLGEFVSVVLKETEDVFSRLFPQQLGRPYDKPVLVLFEQATRSACGSASAATGPFYCPADEKVYIDLSFYNTLKNRFNAPGDFAMAYVIAHEVGHHIQHQLGITTQVDRQRGRISQAAYNDLSVRLELQADFLAGVWAHYADRMTGIVESGDIEEAMRAAEAIGDDKLQMQSQGRVRPETFTHGTSAQRMRWFMKGYKTGDLRQGDTFQANAL
ncbi:MAG: neutral zinc metallopeptidase [Bacteroidota bacterium]